LFSSIATADNVVLALHKNDPKTTRIIPGALPTPLGVSTRPAPIRKPAIIFIVEEPIILPSRDFDSAIKRLGLEGGALSSSLGSG
jgi:hypothetical protein